MNLIIVMQWLLALHWGERCESQRNGMKREIGNTTVRCRLPFYDSHWGRFISQVFFPPVTLTEVDFLEGAKD